MMRRTLVTVIFAASLLVLAPGVDAQLKMGIHGAYAADTFGGAYGAGASVEVGFPLFPLDVFVAGEYLFPDCGAVSGCGSRGGSADLHLKLPVPVVTPYLTAGLVYRRTDAGGGAAAVTNTGFGAGAGLNLGALVLGGYAEARYEVVEPADQWVLRLGIRF